MRGSNGKKTATSMTKDWDAMVESLKTYRNVTGKNDFISKDYVIPSTFSFPSHLHGIKLGKLLNRARDAFRQGLFTQNQIDTLNQFQIHWDYEYYRYEFISLPALDMYKKIFGHIKVSMERPYYVIPSKQPWPENLWGVKLGIQVMRWRKNKDTLPLEVVKALDEREFIWDACEYDFQTITIPALKTYRELKGNLLVPASFCVPASSQWPKCTHGYKLGQAANNARLCRGIDTAKDEILDLLEFIWDPRQYGFETRILPACKVYVQQKGDLNTMPRSFRVPKTPNLYPIACHGYGLGQILHAWRLNGTRPDKLEEIKALGFKPDPISFSRRDLTRLLKGLKWFQTNFGYKERMNTLKTPTCLPDDHPSLPRLPLGELFRRAKIWDEEVGFSDADRKELKVFASWNSVYQSTIYPLMEIYSKLHGNLNIPKAFLVPSCSPWPTWSWKQKFGCQVTSGIRGGKLNLLEEEKAVLESMDFKWGPKGRTPQRASKRHKAK